MASNTIQWQIIRYNGKPKGRRYEASAKEICMAETWHFQKPQISFKFENTCLKNQGGGWEPGWWVGGYFICFL